MNELQTQRKLKQMAMAFASISVVILLCGLYASSLFSNIFQSTQEEQARSQIVEYQNNLIRKLQSDQQPLYTLAGFLEFSSDLESEHFVQERSSHIRYTTSWDRISRCLFEQYLV